jgi:hypothetical protein
MSEQVEFSKSLTLLGLQRKLRESEGLFGSLEKIGNKPSATIADYQGVTAPTPEKGLVLRNDVGGQTAPAPPGGTLICSGTVFIGSNEELQDVSAFRLP